MDFDVDEGEIVALLGTNGAGKSTLLRAISGLAEPTNGAIIFDGRDTTHTPPDEIAARGIATVPGGQGTFPSLTVAEHLRLAGWTRRHLPGHTRADDRRAALEHFPALAERLDSAAGDLSGGQQQMLTLAMAFVAQPRLLLLDELSLGLAPTVVSQLLDVVRELARTGTTIILVEQSVNLALQVADRAYFMEKGEIRFEGPTKDLLERPDVMRSVFLRGAASFVAAPDAAVQAASPDIAPDSPAFTGQLSGAVTPGAPAASGPRLRVVDMTKTFGGIRALDHVSFEVAAGEILGVLGPNGAGKTTLFDVIGGFEHADSGSVFIGKDDGSVDDLTHLPPATRAKRGLGRSFQDARLFPALTVHETVSVALEEFVPVRDPVAAALHLPAVQDSEEAVARRADELIAMLGLEAFRDKFVRELSTGTRRVVDLACVVAHGPRVLLLDEPSSGIAQREAEALGPLLERIRDELSTSLVVIEHDLPLLRSIADRLLALDLGVVIAEGPPETVVGDQRVIAAYLGEDAAAVARSGTRA